MDAVAAAGNVIVIDGENKGGALALGGKQRQIVVVLGMHRSGTSLCAHILSMLGVDMADEAGANGGNGKGHWERWEIMELQDEVLALLNRGYWTPQHDFPLPPAWWADPMVRGIQTRLENFLATRMRNTLFGFKDPRTARLLPLWLQIFKNLNLTPRFVLCLREPSQIARSLHQREGLNPLAGEYRTLNYQIDCFRYISRHDVCIVEYEEWFDNYSNNLNRLMEFLNLEWTQSEADLGVAMASIIDRDLRHSADGLGVAKQPLVGSFYKLATSLRDNSARRDEIDRFINQFVAFQQLLWPFERIQRELTDLAARLPEREARIGELEASLEATNAAGQQREQALSEVLEGRGSELESSRAAQTAAEERQRELTDIVSRLPEREARIAELEAALHSNKTVAQQREQALGEALERRGGELESVRAALTAAEARQRELSAASDISASESTRTLKALEKAERREEALKSRLQAKSDEFIDAQAAMTAELEKERQLRATAEQRATHLEKQSTRWWAWTPRGQ